MSKELARRAFLGELSMAALLTACDPVTASSPAPTPESQEAEGVPRMGDVLLTGRRTGLLLRENRAYEIPDLDRYIALSKLGQYGRKVLPVTSDVLGQYPREQVSAAPTVLDLFTGDLKRNNPNGGEKNVYFSGFMDDSGGVYETVRPIEETFTSLKTANRRKKWEFQDELHFMYGERAVQTGVAEYKASHTARRPEENLEFVDDFAKTIKEQWPLNQFNLIGHSLGGIFAFEFARKHPDAVNNLILINSPVRGIQKNKFREKAVEVLHDTMFRIKAGEEHVTDYLFARWGDAKYQKGLEEFVASFLRSGRKITIIIDQGDPIVPNESAILKGVTPIRTGQGGVPILGTVVDCIRLNCTAAHGSPLRDEKIHVTIGENIGENLAATG